MTATDILLIILLVVGWGLALFFIIKGHRAWEKRIGIRDENISDYEKNKDCHLP